MRDATARAATSAAARAAFFEAADAAAAAVPVIPTPELHTTCEAYDYRTCAWPSRSLACEAATRSLAAAAARAVAYEAADAAAFPAPIYAKTCACAMAEFDYRVCVSLTRDAACEAAVLALAATRAAAYEAADAAAAIVPVDARTCPEVSSK